MGEERAEMGEERAAFQLLVEPWWYIISPEMGQNRVLIPPTSWVQQSAAQVCVLPSASPVFLILKQKRVFAGQTPREWTLLNPV